MSLRWILAVLLLAAGSSPLLSQQSMSGATAPKAQAKPLATQHKNLRQLAKGTVFRDCAACPEMVVIAPGSITAGPPEGQESADGLSQRHTVALENAIGIGKYEVTKAQFARFLSESGYAAGSGCFVWNGSKYEQDPSKDWRNPGFMQGEKEPVVCVNWVDAKAYTGWLTKISGKSYRLPTETEWEYAARAGNRNSRPWGDKANAACRYANVADLSARRGVPGTASWKFHDCDDKRAYTAPVGSYRPNAFGLYDMLGNVWEWTEDCLREEPPVPSENGAASAECTRRVLRGGAWVDSPPFVLYDFRFFIGSEDRDFYIGFRVARSDD